MNPNNTPLGKRENLVVQEFDDEVLVYDLVENKAFCLNQTSSLVWQLCDGKTSVTKISQKITEKLKTPANEDLVWFAIEQLKKENLIENISSLTNPFVGSSRREIIRKVALSSMIALPIISTVIAPLPVQCATCSGVNGMCSTTPDCCFASPSLTCATNASNGVMSCCQGMGFIATGSSGTFDNSVNNCNAPDNPIRQADCQNACCSATATATITACSGGPAGTITCTCA